MTSYQAVLNSLTENSVEETNDGLTKIIKPINSKIFSGEYSPLIFPALEEKYQKVRPIDKNLEKLRTGNNVVGTIDFSGDNVSTTTKIIEYLERKVSVEILTPRQLEVDAVLIYFHGGSFYGGTPADVHDFLKAIAQKSGRQIISVDYSLAPEHPFPSGIWDGAAVILYYQQKLQRTVAIAGDSAGGNIALGASYLCHEMGAPAIEAQILLYPVLTFDLHAQDLWNVNAYPVIPVQKNIRDNLFERTLSLSTIMKEYYLQHDEKIDAPLTSPLAMNEIGFMPRTLFLVGEYDFFRQANEVFAKKLVKAAVPVSFLQYSGMIHAFAPLIGILPQSEDVVNEISSFLRI